VTLETLLGKRGPLAKQLPGFIPREQQQALAHAVEEGLANGQPVLAEAGTGVGKTLAYLVPLVQWLEKSGGRAVVSTHTLALQSQLVERDLPSLIAAMPECTIEPVVMKGRSNYLCLQDLDVALGDIFAATDAPLQKIKGWAKETETGDVAELDFSYKDWSDVAANADTCKGRECRYYNRCFYFKARKHAEESQLIVVNHALFFADLRLKKQNPNAPSLLPSYDAVVFDEAHHVDDKATQSFGLEWNSGRIPMLLSRAKRVEGIDKMLPGAIEALVNRFLLCFTNAPLEGFLSDVIPDIPDKEAFYELRDQVIATLDSLARDFTALAENATDDVEKDKVAGLTRITTRAASELRGATDPEDGYFLWYENRKLRNGNTHTNLMKTPLEIASLFQDTLFSRTERVSLVSATLATGQKFDFLKARLGIENNIETIQGSPFDFANNCLIYIPKVLTPRNDDAYFAELAVAVKAFIGAARGRTFVLCTSYKALKVVETALKEKPIPYPLFVQGDLPNMRLIDAFVEAKNGVLLGTSSFWEGVDIPGEALSCVVIDKIPFPMPDAPLQRARSEAILAAGGDPFNMLSVPQAQIRLKQGVGRLLRTMGDKGVIGILDSRLWTKNYGKGFLADLPPAPRTSTFADVREFFREREEEII
jgi:ATP-dependent DNA helicase DinG